MTFVGSVDNKEVKKAKPRICYVKIVPVRTYTWMCKFDICVNCMSKK